MSAFSAEVFSECGGCQLPRTFFVQAGVPVCSSCGWSPDMSRFSAYQAPTVAECPGCGEESLSELTAGRWACQGCGWEGDPSKKPDGAKVRYNGVMVDAEVAWALQQDKERGQPGGGAKSGKAKKKDNKGGGKFVQDINEADAEQKTIEFVRGARKHVMSLPGVEEDSDFIRAAIAAKILGET